LAAKPLDSTVVASTCAKVVVGAGLVNSFPSTEIAWIVVRDPSFEEVGWLYP
jgi:hypothetical protein